ncbi:MAG: iron-sulfur cluster assembly accessory protein [Rhodomicrobium sp.]
MARARPKVLTLTDAAAERVNAVMARSETPVAGLRVGVKKGGCAGMEYTMEYAAEVRPIDEVVEDKGVRILIEPSAILFLLGTEMDFKSDKLTSGFVFNNPNQTSACGCGTSVEIRAAKEGVTA